LVGAQWKNMGENGFGVRETNHSGDLKNGEKEDDREGWTVQRNQRGIGEPPNWRGENKQLSGKLGADICGAFSCRKTNGLLAFASKPELGKDA